MHERLPLGYTRAKTGFKKNLILHLQPKEGEGSYTKGVIHEGLSMRHYSTTQSNLHKKVARPRSLVERITYRILPLMVGTGIEFSMYTYKR